MSGYPGAGRALARCAFLALSAAGRPFGGMRPRRIYYWLASRGFRHSDRMWVVDRWGNRMRVNPYYVLERDIAAFGEYDRVAHRVIEEHVREGMTCLDIGANIGEMTLHMARVVGPVGRVHAFEPAPSIFSRLEENIAENGLEGVVFPARMAVGDEEGEVSLWTAPEEASNQGMARLHIGSSYPMNRKETARVRTLDGILAAGGMGRIGFVKVDIQGSECRFLRGARTTLRSHRPVLLMEISVSDLRAADETPASMLALLDSLGYGVLLPGKEGWKPVTEADLLSVKSSSDALCIPRERL